MSKKREYKPAGVKARITLNFWFPGIETCVEVHQILARILRLHSQEGDRFFQLPTEQNYWVIEEAKAEKLGLPKLPEPKRAAIDDARKTKEERDDETQSD